jgi:polar amino acid transport system substrate-binding protein
MQPSAAMRAWTRAFGVVFATAIIWCGGGVNRASAEAPVGADASTVQPHIQVVAESWYPYSYEEGGVVKGRATETVRKVLARAGLDYTITLYPWPRAYRMAQERENLLVYAMIKTPAREKLFQFVGQVMEGDSFYFFGLKDRADIQLETPFDAKGFRIATSQDSAMIAFLRDNDYPHIQPLFDIQLGFKQLQYGRVDLVLTTAVNVAAHIHSGDIERGSIVPYGWAFDAEPHMAFSPQTDARVVERVRAAYEELVRAGELPVFGARPYCGIGVLSEGIGESCGGESEAAEEDSGKNRNGGAGGDR